MGRNAVPRFVRNIFQTEYIPQDVVASEALKQVLEASVDFSLCSVFMRCSGVSFCSGCKDVRVFSVRFLCGVRVFSVENLWESLRESLLKTCGKVSTSWQNSEFYTFCGGMVRVFHDFVEKFSYEFSTVSNRGEGVVLHSFHKVYYNYYYYIREFLSGTAKIGGRFRKVNI